MKNAIEIVNTVEFLTSNPMIFSCIGWYAIEDDRGTCCSPKPEDDEEVIEAVKAAFCLPNIYKMFYDSLRAYHQRIHLQRRYCVKALVRLVSDVEDLNEIKTLVRSSLVYKEKEIAKVLETI